MRPQRYFDWCILILVLLVIYLLYQSHPVNISKLVIRFSFDESKAQERSRSLFIGTIEDEGDVFEFNEVNLEDVEDDIEGEFEFESEE